MRTALNINQTVCPENRGEYPASIACSKAGTASMSCFSFQAFPMKERQAGSSLGSCALGLILPKKKPRGVSGGAKFSFLSKEATAISETGNRKF